jgi:glyoxylase-like metal-dependent hydrolase (beta-lactamase superfamily II)
LTWDIKVLDLGSVEIDGSRTVATRAPGIRVRVPVQSFLLVGPEHVVVVDTGFRHPDVLQRIGLRGFEEPEQALDAQLRAHGVRFADVRYVLHTHLHLDHAGQTDKFPLTTTVVVNRRELEYSVSGLSGGSYPPEDVKHLVDRLHTAGSLRLLDLEATDEHILGGIRCSAAGGHTEGSMVVYVETAMGLACLCGDIVYNVADQLLANGVLDGDPILSGNTVTSRRSEKAAIKRVLNSPASFLYPGHDKPAKIIRGATTELVPT